MSRSVSTPSGASLVVYKPYEGQDELDAEQFTEDIQEYFTSRYPSLTECAEWLGREDQAILENRLVYIGISEYCGLVAVWCVPKEKHPDLSAKFVTQIAPYFAKIGEYRKVGTFSNGEAVYEKVGKR